MADPAENGRPELSCFPLTPDRWDDFVTLFGKSGACGGCWCMWWRLTGKEFEENKGKKNRLKMNRIVRSGGNPPGILAYHRNDPVGWCSVAPRREFPRLARSRILKPVDDREVWSVVCLFVDKQYRRRGVSTTLLREAVEHVAGMGGAMVEGYPVEPRKDRMPDLFAYHGLASSFQAAGFHEVLRRSDTRPIMRCAVTPSTPPAGPRGP